MHFQPKQSHMNRFLFFCAFLPLLAGCTKALQTGVFIPDVERKEDGNKCYAPHGIKLVHWANLRDAQEKQKPFIQGMRLDKTNGKAVIYSNIPEGEMIDKDPMNPKNSGIPYLGLQNLISLPVTAISASFEVPSLKKAQRDCEAENDPAIIKAQLEKEQLVRAQMLQDKQNVEDAKYKMLKEGTAPYID